MIVCGVLKTEWIVIFREDRELAFIRPDLLNEEEKNEIEKLYLDLAIILPRLKNVILNVNYTDAQDFVREVRDKIGNPLEFIINYYGWVTCKQYLVKKFGNLTIKIRNNLPMDEYLDYVENPFKTLKGVYSADTKTFLIGRGNKELDFRKVTQNDKIIDYMERGYNTVLSKTGGVNYVWKVNQVKKGVE